VKPIAAILVMLLAAACGRRPAAPAAATAGPEPAAAKGAANSVALDAAGQRSAGVAVELVRVRSLPEVIRATARLGNDENRTWRVGAITDGRVVRVLANAGDMVRQGQVLARLHSHDIHESRAEYQKALAELARANADQALAERRRDRARRLLDLKAGSQAELEHAETELKNAQSRIATAQAEVDRTRTHLTEFLGIPAGNPVHPGALPHGAEDDREFIPVIAPASGVVLARGITPGTVVTPANDLFVISDLATLWANADVNEEFLPRLRPGMPARIFVQAYGREAFSGRVGKLGEAFDPQTRMVRVRIDVPNRGGRLKPEMYASAEIEIGGSRPSVFVPEEATQEVRGETVVFVRTAPDRFEVRPVQLGNLVNGAFEVAAGLKPGDAVAVRGTFILKSEYLKASIAEE
jgi:cobalt-zinc-cadmium efflux system membrane fusion protein